MGIDTQRHRDYFDALKFRTTPVTIIGAGATGSELFKSVVNLGMTNITIFDDDKVENHNLANQIYDQSDVGGYKVNGLCWWLERKIGTEALFGDYVNKRVEGNMKSDMKGVVFLLTDTMSSRKEIYENSLRFNKNVDYVIETRMGLTHGNVMMFDPKNTKQSKEWLATLVDDDAHTTDVSLCGTALTIGTTASIIANLAVNLMIHEMRGDMPDPQIEVFLEPLFINTQNWEN